MEKARAIFLPSRGFIWPKNPRGSYISLKISSEDGTGLLSRA